MSLGALAQWRREIAAGLNGQDARTPSTWVVADPLYRAACCEAQALDAHRAGLPEAAAAWLLQAAEALRAATTSSTMRGSA